ncbi:pyridoxamine 5'-phosphate oxidase family protein, partial [Pseudomonas sp. HY2-MNA-CIBAN-0224]
MDTIQSMVKDIKYTMMTTRNGENHLHSCPMNTTETSIGAKEIWFIGHK